jgi:hypothetical protein
MVLVIFVVVPPFPIFSLSFGIQPVKLAVSLVLLL